MTESPLWIAEADVAALLALPDAIDALERGLCLEAHGEAHNMLKTHVAWGNGHTLHAIGAAVPGAGFAGTKTWAHTAAGATPLLILFDSQTGALRAIIEAFTLGQLRTGGISGVATRWLARADADELAVIGTGKQAYAQVAAVATVRELQRVRVYSPNPEHRATFVSRLRSAFAFDVVASGSVADAVDGVAIVTLVTRAREPFLHAAMLAPGTHVNAVGAITPDRVEFAADLFGRCAMVAADSVPTVRQLSREFIDHYGADDTDWDTVLPLSRLVAEQHGRPLGADLTLFKAMGMGVADLSIAIEVYARAMQQGAGRTLQVHA